MQQLAHECPWHSEDLTFRELVRRRLAADYHYVVHRGATVGSNDPRTFTVFLNARAFASPEKPRESRRIRRERIKEKRKEEEIRRRVERIRPRNERRKRSVFVFRGTKREASKAREAPSWEAYYQEWRWDARRGLETPCQRSNNNAHGNFRSMASLLFLDSTAKRIIHEASVAARETGSIAFPGAKIQGKG